MHFQGSRKFSIQAASPPEVEDLPEPGKDTVETSKEARLRSGFRACEELLEVLGLVESRDPFLISTGLECLRSLYPLPVPYQRNSTNRCRRFLDSNALGPETHALLLLVEGKLLGLDAVATWPFAILLWR